MERSSANYLAPYHEALRRLGGDSFEALLWASPDTQAMRFAAILEACPLAGKRILDAGCGRADLLDYLLAQGQAPAEYIGLEAVEAFAEAAGHKLRKGCRIVHGEFVDEPARLFTNSQVIVFSGSLNTLPAADFYRTLHVALDAAVDAVVLNFLDSPTRAAATYLTWHAAPDVAAFCRSMGAGVMLKQGYLDGDTTLAAIKPASP